MRRTFPSTRRSLSTLVLLGVAWVGFGFAQAPSQTTLTEETQKTGELLNKLDLLIEQNTRLEEQNRALMEQIQSLRKGVADQARLKADQPQQDTSKLTPPTPIAELPDKTEEVAEKTEPKKWGNYTPNFGYKVVDTEKGDMSISVYTYARYLNQRALDDTFTDSFGNVKKIQQRQDFQLTKVQIKFLGWVMSPKFRYFLYGWTNNATQGLPAQVVLAGNLNYSFNDHLTLSAGITSLPGTRSVEGNFPFWLGVDARMITDEFFRPSYTSGIWARGQISKKLRYQAMLGNNLSTLGVSAAQLDKGFNTFAGALVWTPTTGEFGPGFGDFEDHQKLATRLAVHYTRSNEDKQSQPNSESFENTQLRLSDGNVIFNPNLFGPGITITDARYRMSTADGGVKYHGIALEGEYFWRWLDDFKGPGTATVPNLFDHGFQIQPSAMVIPKTLQLYAGYSKIFGQFGHPYDARFGANWFPWKNKVIRWNSEVLYLSRSPVGYTAVPFPSGGNGFIFHSTLELAF
jgi:hypothetical protein